jgi:periplasmic protein TonB
MKVQYASKTLPLPWTDIGSERRFFRFVLAAGVALFIVLGLLIPFYEVPPTDRKQDEALPPQLARIIKQRELEKPKPVIPPAVIEKPKPVEKKEEIEQPKIKDKPLPSIRKPEQKAPPKLTASPEAVKQAREVAKKSGLLALQSEMQALTDQVTNNTFAAAGNSAKSAETSARRVETLSRDAATKGSGAQAQEAVALSKQDRALVAQKGSQLQETRDEAALAVAESQPRVRKNSDVQAVIENLRSSFNLLYNRALRNDPFLEGELVLEVTVEPDGSVSRCKVVSSSLSDTALVNKIVSRMRLASFGEKQVDVFTKQFSFEFSPN